MVESGLIKCIKENRQVSVEEINKIISREKDKWFSSTQYQGIWLDKMKSANAGIARSFENILKEMKISKVENIPSSSFIPYGLIAAATAVVSYYLTRYLKLASWQIWGATIIAPIFIGGMLFTFWKEDDKTKKINSRGLYMNQLDRQKEELIKLCETLDNKR